MTKLEKMREEGAIELMNSIFRLEPYQEPPDFDECFKHGFDASTAYHAEIIQELVKAASNVLTIDEEYQHDKESGPFNLVYQKWQHEAHARKEALRAALESVRSKI